MNQQSPITGNTTPGIALCEKPEGFAAIRTADCAAVIWRRHPASGLLHRPPSIAGTGETRLVLILDPIFDPEDAE